MCNIFSRTIKRVLGNCCNKRQHTPDISPTCIADIRPACLADIRPACLADIRPACLADISPACIADIRPACLADTEIVNILGTGANSTVYKIKKNNKFFIRKEVPNKYMSNINREKHILKKLNRLHKSNNDFPLYVDSYSDQNVSGIITEYREGVDLFNWFNTKRIDKIDKTIIRRVFKEMIRLVFILHKNGYVHLDIKLENFIILKTNDNNIKLSLIDFDMTHIHCKEKTKLNKMVGTRGYCDYYIYNKEYSDKSDVWSLGVCLRTLIERKNLFDHSGKQLVTKDDFIPRKCGRKVYKKYEHTAIPLINSMLQIEHEDRVSIEDVFNNKWLNS
jgi:serine/threonine protein kinase